MRSVPSQAALPIVTSQFSSTVTVFHHSVKRPVEKLFLVRPNLPFLTSL
jgi:hypothetical protein